MRQKGQEILVGLFVLALGTALIAGVLWLGAGGPGRSYQLYVVYMTESVAGLSRDGAVKYRGVDVGRIRDIGLAPGNPELVRLLLEIEAGTPVKQDTIATLETQGLTGLAHINLLGGSQAAAALDTTPGEEHPVIPSRPSVWGRLDRSLGELVDNLIEGSERLNALLSEENLERLAQLLRDVGRLVEVLADGSDTLTVAVDELAAAMHQVREASADLPGLVGQLNASALALEKMANEIATTGVHVRRAVAARNADLQQFTAATLPEAALMVQELRLAAENFRRMSESLQRDPGLLLRGAGAPRPGPGE